MKHLALANYLRELNRTSRPKRPFVVEDCITPAITNGTPCLNMAAHKLGDTR